MVKKVNFKQSLEDFYFDCAFFRDLNNYLIWSLVNKLDLSVLPERLAKARADFEKVRFLKLLTILVPCLPFENKPR